MKKCVFAGTFDPPTVGHKEIIDDCLKIFDEVVVAVMLNNQKTPLLSEEERCSLLKKLYSGNPAVKVVTFDGAVVDLLEAENTPFFVRGVRNTIDFEYENQNYFASKKLKEDLIEIYIPARQDSLQISSTLVRNSLKFKKDFKSYIPLEIYDDVMRYLEKKDV
jgi:pantetheine-phosphate adenylyltransferase